MNRKFFLNGVIVSKLMNLKELSVVELALRLNKTQQAVSQIRRRDIIKYTDAIKILSAFGLSLEEVEKMDSEGVFSKNYIPDNSIDSSENQYFQDFSNKMEVIIDKMNQQYSDELNRLRAELHEKELVIQAKNKIIVAFVDSMVKNVA